MRSPRVKRFNAETNRLFERYRDTRDETLFAEFLDRAEPVVFSVFLKKRFKHDDIEEAFHLGGIDLFRTADKWDENRGDVIPLFLTCVRNRLLQILRSRKRLKSKERSVADLIEPRGGFRADAEEILDTATAPEPQDGERLDDAERRTIRDAEETLKPIQRDAARLMLGGLRVVEIARRLGVSRQVVDCRLKSIRKSFTELPLIQRIYNVKPVVKEPWKTPLKRFIRQVSTLTDGWRGF